MKNKEILTNNNKKFSASSQHLIAEKSPTILLDEFEKSKLVELKGKLTSQIWTKKSTDAPSMLFWELMTITSIVEAFVKELNAELVKSQLFFA
ncbi:MAG: hypothetical protein GBAus27B_000479 [Mycoplasmataceae bacterium]|nr:MAG: hypothetical protein GBAus27B_000479 [Mycoplasmataceae bacterium]